MKNMNKTAFPNSGIDASNDPMSFRIYGTALTDLSGLKTLIVLRAFSFGIPGMFSNMPIHTTWDISHISHRLVMRSRIILKNVSISERRRKF